jgi:hypothetical protein
LAGGTGRFSQELSARGIPYRGIRHLASPVVPVKDLLALLEIVRALREIKPDIVSAHTAKAGLLGRIANTSLSVAERQKVWQEMFKLRETK